MTDESSSQALAEACAAAMYERDYTAQSLGMHLQEIHPGCARISMKVRKDMVNGHDICHGGMIFTLADTAFAYACNTGNRITVAAGCSIDYITPAHLGDELTAAAQERSLRGRNGIYDIAVYNQHQELIALFRGKSRQIKGEIVPGWQNPSGQG